MAGEESNSKAKIKIKPKQKRPDGVDLSRYKHPEKWSYRKWAWEFLRRNKDFIDDCKKVDGGTEEEKQAVAKQYGLKRFKKYTEGYKAGAGCPLFAIGAISSWSNLDCDEKDGHLARIRICHGQVVIRFDLASAIEEKKALEKQLRLARQRLNKHLAAYEKQIQKVAKIHKHKAINFGIYLRLLDYLAMGKNTLECAKLVYPKKGDGRTRAQLQSDIKDPIKSANHLALDGYRYLSVLRGRPNGKGIPLEM